MAEKTLESILAGPSLVRQRWLPAEIAVQEVVAFERHFGAPHLWLACHAALPLILTPELVNLIRINFLGGTIVPWIAESDFLLSPLCRLIDDGLFEVEPSVREVLLIELESQFGNQQSPMVADFLLAYLYEKPGRKQRSDVNKAHQWIAQSYYYPDKVINEMIEYLEKDFVSTSTYTQDLSGQIQILTMSEVLKNTSVPIASSEKLRYLSNSSSVLAQILYGNIEGLRQSFDEDILKQEENHINDILISPVILDQLKGLFTKYTGTSEVAPSFDRLVGREHEIETFTYALAQVQNQDSDRAGKNLLEWYGGPGIGKSALVRLLQRECKKANVPFTSINFLDLNASLGTYLEDPTQLLEVILKGLDPQPNALAEHFQHLVAEYRAQWFPQNVIRTYFNLSSSDRLYQTPDWLNQLRNIVVAFLGIFQDLGKNLLGQVQPVVTMFDETEFVDVELADWIEEWVLSPLLQFNHCIVVWISRRPWRWKRPEVRRRLQSSALTAFKDKDIRRQIDTVVQGLSEASYEKIHTMTRGHPYAIAVVIAELGTWKGVITPEILADRQAELYATIFDTFINRYVLRTFELDIAIACKLLAMVRLFDNIMLRAILEGAHDDMFIGKSVEYYTDLMNALKKTQLLVWDKGYAIDPDLRYLVQQYYYFCEREVYLSVNALALDVYRDWLTRPVDNRGTFVIEELYHLACTQRAGQVVDIKAVFRERLVQYSEWYKHPEALTNALMSLREQLEHDKELSEYTTGLSETVLIQMVQEVLDQVYENEQYTVSSRGTIR